MVDLNTNVDASANTVDTTNQTTNKTVNQIAAENGGFIENKDERTRAEFSVRAAWKARDNWDLVRKLYVDWNDACESTNIGTYSLDQQQDK